MNDKTKNIVCGSTLVVMLSCFIIGVMGTKNRLNHRTDPKFVESTETHDVYMFYDAQEGYWKKTAVPKGMNLKDYSDVFSKNAE